MERSKCPPGLWWWWCGCECTSNRSALHTVLWRNRHSQPYIIRVCGLCLLVVDVAIRWRHHITMTTAASSGSDDKLSILKVSWLPPQAADGANYEASPTGFNRICMLWRRYGAIAFLVQWDAMKTRGSGSNFHFHTKRLLLVLRTCIIIIIFLTDELHNFGHKCCQQYLSS